MYLTKKLSAMFLACGVIFSANVAQAQEPNRPECIAPAQPGCQYLRTAFAGATSRARGANRDFEKRGRPHRSQRG